MHHFFAYMARMRFIDRWALMRNSYTENIQEHSHQVAILAHALAVLRNAYFGGQVDAGAVAVAALYHDASEILTGDLPTPIKYYNPDIRDAYKQVEANAKRLAQKRKDEIDPEEYHVFLSSYQKLGAESRAVIDAMVDGVSAQVLAEQLGKKMSTVYSYRRDIYEKVGIQGENKLQQLRVRVSLMRREQTEYGGSPAPSNGEIAGQAVNR